MSASGAGTIEKPGKKVTKQKSGLNRSILRQGWGELGRCKVGLQGTLARRLCRIPIRKRIQANAVLACGHTSKEEPQNAKAEFVCVECGFSANADDVAAQNQLQKFLSSDKGAALLASGSRASVTDSLWSVVWSWDSRYETGTHRKRLRTMRNSQHGILSLQGRGGCQEGTHP